jgi:glutathione synthase/RimK-type ligase-like ATP-grasp enzyme
MRDWIAVVEPADAELLKGAPVRRSDEYLQGSGDCLTAGWTVINLCRSYDYLTVGYYVSLVADARGHRVRPGVDMVEDLASPFTYFRALREAGIDTIDYKVVPGRRLVVPKLIVASDEVRERTQGRALADVEEEGPDVRPRYVSARQNYTEVTVIFGRAEDKRFRRVCAAIYRIYPYPILTVRMYEIDGEWKTGQIFPSSIRKLSEEQLELLREELADAKFVRDDRPRPQPRPERLACLWEHDENLAPSDEPTLEKLARVAARRNVLVERIGRSDLTRLAEYDALFIRSFTAINNFTFTFAQTAESLDIPVIDDPDSIVRCSNKVYLHELFRRSGIPTPRTKTISRRTEISTLAELGFPMIVKLPDGSFSQAVKKVDDAAAFEAVTSEMFKRSPLLIVQEFTPSEFDWRIGVLEGKLLYACRYFMASKHWQIQQSYKSGYTRYGKVDAVGREDAPPEIVSLAIDAAALIGNGLYGVDIKETANGPVVIEINDNPSIETGYEDQADKDRIYEDIVDAFVGRISESARVEAR